MGSHPAGTEQQSFCYDEQNRLIWAGTSGTPSGSAYGTCGPTPQTSTLDSGGYTATYAYDTQNRLTTGPAGSYTYGDSAHLHAATATSAGYTASYDAAGHMLCRAPTSSMTCSGTQTGAQLSYDNEGHLIAWQNAPSSPTTTAAFAYDGGGHRVEQQVTVNGSMITTTVCVGSLEEGIGGTLTTYPPGAGAGRSACARCWPRRPWRRW